MKVLFCWIVVASGIACGVTSNVFADPPVPAAAAVEADDDLDCFFLPVPTFIGPPPPHIRFQVRLLESLVKTYPDDPDAHFELGMNYLMLGKKDAARGELMTVTVLRPRDFVAKRMLKALGGPIVAAPVAGAVTQQTTVVTGAAAAVPNPAPAGNGVAAPAAAPPGAAPGNALANPAANIAAPNNANPPPGNAASGNNIPPPPAAGANP